MVSLSSLSQIITSLDSLTPALSQRGEARVEQNALSLILQISIFACPDYNGRNSCSYESAAPASGLWTNAALMRIITGVFFCVANQAAT